jgi:hypothetical protein
VRLTLQRTGEGAPAATALVQPVVCAGGPLRLEAWPVDRVRTPNGWRATIYAKAYGGDCRYTYAWERQVVGGPTSGAVTFDVTSRGGRWSGRHP